MNQITKEMTDAVKAPVIFYIMVGVLLNAVGDIPVWFLKTLRKYMSDAKPSRSDISPTVRSGRAISRRCASSVWRRSLYSIGETPRVFLNIA